MSFVCKFTCVRVFTGVCVLRVSHECHDRDNERDKKTARFLWSLVWLWKQDDEQENEREGKRHIDSRLFIV